MCTNLTYVPIDDRLSLATCSMTKLLVLFESVVNSRWFLRTSIIQNECFRQTPQLSADIQAIIASDMYKVRFHATLAQRILLELPPHICYQRLQRS
jgi:hypothetical protein